MYVIISESNAWGFRLLISGMSEHSRRFSEDFRTLPKMSEDDLFNDDILLCCDKVKRLFGLFSGILNLVFVINHVFKNNSSEFVRRREWLSLMRETHAWCVGRYINSRKWRKSLWCIELQYKTDIVSWMSLGSSVLSCTHHFKASATQATQLGILCAL